MSIPALRFCTDDTGRYESMYITTSKGSYSIVLHCVMDEPETWDELEAVLESGMYLEPNKEINIKLDKRQRFRILKSRSASRRISFAAMSCRLS